MSRTRFAGAAAALIAVLAAAPFAPAALAVGPARQLPTGAELTLPRETHATSLAIGPEGLPWFGVAGPSRTDLGEPSTEAIYHVTAGGELATVPLPASAAHYFGTTIVAFGPEGSLWFSRATTGLSIGRLASDGQVTEFPVATDEAGVGDFTVGPEGDAWFTLPYKGLIGRMAPDGALTEYGVGPKAQPMGVTVAAGATWFTEEGAGRVGRIDPSGAISFYPLGRGVHPRDIVADAAGNLWFGENAHRRRLQNGQIRVVDRIGRLDAAGQLRQIKVPFGSGTVSLIADPRGSIWFTTADGEIGSISTTTGTFGGRRCLPVGCAYPPAAFGFSPDGTLWWGAGVQQCNHCGGGTGLLSEEQPGTLGSAAPAAFTAPVPMRR
jgi:virginiamycin B lyase